jgi:5-methylcytosine-specific restriction endonuclease McrBC regulatory subunit McrC
MCKEYDEVIEICRFVLHNLAYGWHILAYGLAYEAKNQGFSK